MAHPLKEREFLVDKAIELGLFKTAFHDQSISNGELDTFVEELKDNGIDPNKAYRVVSVNNGKEMVSYTSRDGLVMLLGDDEEGFDFIWKAVKERLEANIDEEQGVPVVSNEDYDEEYENL